MFVAKPHNDAIGFCIGEMAAAMCHTFTGRFILVELADYATWRRLRWVLPAAIDDALEDVAL